MGFGRDDLVATGVSALRGERPVLRDLSLRVPPGGALLLLGPNGAGKSTLLRVLAGLKRADAGGVAGGTVAYLGHLDAVKPALTVRETLRFPPPGPAVVAALGLDALLDVPGRMLSAGQKRRVALARVAGSGAAVWLLDEPTLGLDAASVEALGGLLARHRAAGGIVVAATHLALPLPGAAVLDLTAGSPGCGASPVRSDAAGPITSGHDVGAALRNLLRRELLLSFRHGADTLAAVLFFVLVALLFPLAIGPAPETLARLSPGIVWVGALLAALLPLDRLFGADHEDGTLDQLLLPGLPAPAVAAGKALAHWLTTGLPLLLAAAPVALMLQMPPGLLPVLLAGLVPGTLALSLLGTLGAALVVGARRGGVLLPLLVLPLLTPVLIFGAAAVEAAGAGLSPRPHLLLLCAMLAAALPLAPLAAGAALRAAGE